MNDFLDVSGIDHWAVMGSRILQNVFDCSLSQRFCENSTSTLLLLMWNWQDIVCCLM